MMAVYPKVFELKFEDGSVTMKADFRAQMIEMKRVQCSAACPSMREPISEGRFKKIHAAIATEIAMRNYRRSAWNNGGEEEQVPPSSVCPYCKSQLTTHSQMAVKFYFTFDRRLRPELFVNDLMVYGEEKPGRPVVFKKMEKQWYGGTRDTMFALFREYKDFEHMLKTLRLREGAKGATLGAMTIPSEELLWQGYQNYQKRKFADSI